jgi:hypothetical protein
MRSFITCTFPSSVIRMIKSRKMKWAEDMKGKEECIDDFCGKMRKKKPLRRQVFTSIKLEWRDIGWSYKDYIDVAEARDQWKSLVNMVINHKFP